MGKIAITTGGIKQSLSNYNALKSICEYIWNGFDARGTKIEITTKRNDLDSITEISIKDNGTGIIKKQLNKKFKPFYESEKSEQSYERTRITGIHGKNGVGRLTFFCFARYARWDTVYQDNTEYKSYSINIDANNLEKYDETPENVVTNTQTGTIVTLSEIYESIDTSELKEYIKKEFACLLELNRNSHFKIYIDGKEVKYDDLVLEREEFKLNYKYEDDEINANIRYVQWKNNLSNEYSRYYFEDEDERFKLSMTTTLNKKGDNFYHSVFVSSNLFEDFYTNDTIEGQIPISGYNKDSKEFKTLKLDIDKFLRKKRKPHIKRYAEKLIEKYNEDKIFPEYNENNVLDKFKHEQLENIVKLVCQIEPKIVASLNNEQKRTLVRLFDLAMQSGETDNLFVILNEVVELDAEERAELAEELQYCTLGNITKTIKLVQDRYRAIDLLKQLLYDYELNANERDHLQKFIEEHYWIFGEQYTLVTAAEPKFEEALRRYTKILTGEDEKKYIDHKDKNKEMDIFAVRQNIQNDSINNIVIELKHPKKLLGQKQYQQIYDYMKVISEQPEFIANNATWEFYLIGNKFDTSGDIDNLYENAKMHGEKSLVYKVKNFKIYVKTWSEILNEFEIKHKFIQDKLELQRNAIVENSNNIEELMEKSKNSAVEGKAVNF